MPTISLTEAERDMLVGFLEQLSDVMGNAGCNDFDLPTAMPDAVERRQFVLDYYDYNGEHPPADEAELLNKYALPDFCVVALLRHKLEQAE